MSLPAFTKMKTFSTNSGMSDNKERRFDDPVSA
jgi:hypothetical protein